MRKSASSHAWCRLIAALVLVKGTQSNFHQAHLENAFIPVFPGLESARRKTSTGTLFQPTGKRFTRIGEQKFPLVCRSMFFRTAPPEKRARWRVPESALVDLCTGGQGSLPYQIHLEYDEEDESDANIPIKTLTVRFLEEKDLTTVLPMCLTEFEGGENVGIRVFPWKELTWPNVKEWFNRLTFVSLLELSIRMKTKLRQDGDNPFNVFAKPDNSLVCLSEGDKIVGMIELSLQPPDAKRNPPPFPLPLWMKQLISKQKGLPPPEGWITNLLVDERYRRLGYGKVLCCAVEGLARSWGCNYIYLHTVADTVSGAVPQTLYRGLNYEPVLDQRSENQYAWMGPELLKLGLYIVDGVPLLFLRKQLNIQ